MWHTAPEDVVALNALIQSRLEVPAEIPALSMFGHAGKTWRVHLRIENKAIDTPRLFLLNAVRDAQGKPMTDTEMESLDMLTIMQCQRHAVQVAALVLAGKTQLEGGIA
jgi:hypothetical protein